MFSLPVRIFLIVIASAYGSYQLLEGNLIGVAWIAAAAILGVGYFRYGPIRPAFRAMRRGNFEVARNLIKTIKFPNLLSSQSRAYLHWINAVLATQDPQNLQYAEAQMRLAIGGSLRTANDRCLATATLAHIVAQTHDIEKAWRLLAEAENIPHRQNVAEYLNHLKSEFEHGQP